ncbi:MAG: cell wall hydrolase [Sphingobium sp.]
MRFPIPAALAATLCFGTATLTVASVSNAAGVLPGHNQATVTLPDMALGMQQQPRLEAAIGSPDETMSVGTRIQPVPAIADAADQPATSLAALVERNDDDVTGLDSEMQCLASAIFYEARSESLAGKLAVARVIINRSESGRFPSSICGVVKQPSQFSFVRGGRIPSVPASARFWPDSVAIARIAMADSWESQAEGALYFHARRVSPGWSHQRLAQIDNHIFYR